MDKPFKHKQVTVAGKTRWTVTKNHIPYKPFEEFLSHAATISIGDGENTSKAYAANLAEFANFLSMEGYDWWDVVSSVVTSYVEWVKRDGPRLGNVENIQREDKNESAYAPRSINQRTGAILSCFDYHQGKGEFQGINLRAWKKVAPSKGNYKAKFHGIKGRGKNVHAVNPWNQKIKKTVPPVLEPQEVQFLIDSKPFLRDKLLLSALYDTGVRIGEALGMRHEDFNPSSNSFDVVSRENANKAKVKNKSERQDLPLKSKTMGLYARYLVEEYPEDIDSDYVFVVLKGDTRGNALVYDTVYKMIMRLRPKFEARFGHSKPFSPHWFRHSFGTDAMESDKSGGRTTQEIMGHAQLQTTTGTYDHPRKETKKNAMDIVHENRDKRLAKAQKKRLEDEK